MTNTYWLERASVDGRLQDGVLVDIRGGRFRRVETNVPSAPDGVRSLAGLTIPGLANAHSHAFHRALRGHTQRDRGTFWTWREQMYALAGTLTPDSYYDLARATYREMAAAGITAVGEFHYLHHGPEGKPYDDPNAMGHALVDAARDVGVRVTLLDTCYLTSGIGTAPEGVQLRFSDGDAGAWQDRVEALPGGPDVRIGAAVHSVRAVPRDQMRFVVDWADRHAAPLHVHLSEQVAENRASVEAYGETPTGVLAETGVLGPRTTGVHVTHLTDDDVALLGTSRTYSCLCPTTERDLGDGIGSSRLLHDAGSRLTIGSDSHAVIDPFEEMRAVEMDERLSSQERGQWSAGELITAATVTGHESLGYADAGRIAVGALADLVTLDLSSPRTAGTGASEETVVFAATSADVVHVVAGGRVVATRDDQQEIGAALDRVISRLWGDA